MERVVLNIGGSLLWNSQLDAGYMQGLSDTLVRMSEHLRLWVVVGGGRPAREFMRHARRGCSPENMDWIGIYATRINAQLLISYLDSRAFPEVPSSTREAAAIEAPIVVMGGTVPGHTTDAVTAMLARDVKASRVVIATDVDGVYTSDPRTAPDAELIERMDYRQLAAMSSESHSPGGSYVVDPKACTVLSREGIPLAVVNGRALERLENAAYGRDFAGTKVGWV